MASFQSLSIKAKSASFRMMASGRIRAVEPLRVVVAAAPAAAPAGAATAAGTTRRVSSSRPPKPVKRLEKVMNFPLMPLRLDATWSFHSETFLSMVGTIDCVTISRDEGANGRGIGLEDVPCQILNLLATLAPLDVGQLFGRRDPIAPGERYAVVVPSPHSESCGSEGGGSGGRGVASSVRRASSTLQCPRLPRRGPRHNSGGSRRLPHGGSRLSPWLISRYSSRNAWIGVGLRELIAMTQAHRMGEGLVAGQRDAR